MLISNFWDINFEIQALWTYEISLCNLGNCQVYPDVSISTSFLSRYLSLSRVLCMHVVYFVFCECTSWSAKIVSAMWCGTFCDNYNVFFVWQHDILNFHNNCALLFLLLTLCKILCLHLCKFLLTFTQVGSLILFSHYKLHVFCTLFYKRTEMHEITKWIKAIQFSKFVLSLSRHFIHWCLIIFNLSFVIVWLKMGCVFLMFNNIIDINWFLDNILPIFTKNVNH